MQHLFYEGRSPKAIAAKRLRERNRYRADPAAHYARVRKAQLLRDYGLTIEEHERLVSEQENKCKLCGSGAEEQRYKKLHIDHDHSTKKVRGLLCHNCNRMLGYAKDNPELLERAAAYIREHNDKPAA